jgi:hypothetical protein
MKKAIDGYREQKLKIQINNEDTLTLQKLGFTKQHLNSKSSQSLLSQESLSLTKENSYEDLLNNPVN